MKVKVLRGLHSDGGRVWKKGQVIDTDKDLLRFNVATAPKFERVDDNTPAHAGTVLNAVTRGEWDDEQVVAVAEEDAVTLVEDDIPPQDNLEDGYDEDDEEEEEEEEASTGEYDEAELKAMKVAQLEPIAEELGVDLDTISKSIARRKKQLIAAILDA